MSEKISLTIDGKDLTVTKGTSVMEATKMMGTEVPHFCWHPGLSVAGVCRFCMVKIEGMPKLQIACNTICTDGMKVYTKTPEVKDSHKWALEFHLINHPLDCPICDQAGECELQNYYMKVGRYNSQMGEDKVLKPKALDVGDNLVLDTERCILCSRCVRFEDEVTKTNSLGIFNRGDHSVIGTFPNRKVQHNYSYNLVDICPVGAFTAKDFRFKCRVWFLKETPSICPGCSTGCNVTLFQNRSKREYYRLKPLENKDVNGYWMCDYGRTMYFHLNASERISAPVKKGKIISWKDVHLEIDLLLKDQSVDDLALIFTPHYTCEEYDLVLSQLKTLLGALPKVYVWRPVGEDVEAFDGILMRGDKHPNTNGLKKVLHAHEVNPILISNDCPLFASQAPKITFIFGPEIQKAYPNFQEDLLSFSKLPQVVYFGSSPTGLENSFTLSVPTKVFAEKKGTFVNYKGLHQKLTPAPLVFPAMLGLEDLFKKG